MNITERQDILNNAPDTATHFRKVPMGSCVYYYRKLKGRFLEVYFPNTNSWEYPNVYNQTVQSLEELRDNPEMKILS